MNKKQEMIKHVKNFCEIPKDLKRLTEQEQIGFANKIKNACSNCKSLACKICPLCGLSWSVCQCYSKERRGKEMTLKSAARLRFTKKYCMLPPKYKVLLTEEMRANREQIDKYCNKCELKPCKRCPLCAKIWTYCTCFN
jgi:hypothetical protein